MEAALLAEEAGRTLASAPLLESIVPARFLAELGEPFAQPWLEGVLAGTRSSRSVCTRSRRTSPRSFRRGGGRRRAERCAATRCRSWRWIGAASASQSRLSAHRQAASLRARRPRPTPFVLATGVAARTAFLGAVEEWKLLMAAQAERLVSPGARRARSIARSGSCSVARSAPSKRWLTRLPIAAVGRRRGATLHMVGHPAGRRAQAGRGCRGGDVLLVVMPDSRTKPRVGRSIPSAVGVTLEYDLQLYFRRAKAWPLVWATLPKQLSKAGAGCGWARMRPCRTWRDGDRFRIGEEAEALATRCVRSCHE